jgi:hypothetical protein
MHTVLVFALVFLVTALSSVALAVSLDRREG